ncbi:MAG: triose-phosphate isomerase [Thermoplasmata archaeon]|nr:triose-phosphate isomerase [Thermoplasmata archaeon]
MPARSRIEYPPLGPPLFLLNLKSYPTSIGRRADRLAKELGRRCREEGVPCAVVPALPDLGRLARNSFPPAVSPHTDSRPAGAATGWVTAESVGEAGAVGSLLNHSERPLAPAEVGRSVARLRALGLRSIVCARTPAEAGRLARFRPEFVAIEPPELIGGKVSVSTARPEVITQSLQAVRTVSPRTILLCGAGIHDRHDVSAALRLGARGVLVSSAVACASRPARAIDDLLAGFRAV